ncbi:hypothetical protein [Cellulomonas taurus]|uniref:hypothetical protein n=1 Tax=Cellulomonas taurus TaxID=2729175 RepID=UPI00197DD6A4|nr:hypothetical protein [Cellulomonas taurus]
MSEHDVTSGPDESDLSALTAAASDTLSVRRVFGDAYEQDGALIIPVAVVLGTHVRASAGGRGRVGDGRRRGRSGGQVTGADGGVSADAPTAGSGTATDASTATAASAPGATSTTAESAPGGPHVRGGAARWWGHLRPVAGQARGAGRAGAGGFASHARPLGVYVVRDGEVTWRPALDLNRVILGGQIVGAVVGTALAVTLPIAAALARRR